MNIEKLKENEFFIPVIALIIGFLAGMVAGFLIAPAKNGFNVLCNNAVDRSANLGSNNTADHYDEYYGEN